MTMIEGFTSTSSFLQETLHDHDRNLHLPLPFYRRPSMTMIEGFTSTSSFLQETLHDHDRRIYIYLFLFTGDPP